MPAEQQTQSRAALAAALIAGLLVCDLARPHAATSNTVLFDREIVRILNAHCVMCHSQDGVSIPLESYEQTWLRRAQIHNQTLARRMPPWPAVPGYGDFLNSNALTLREQRFIVSWVEGLGPRNDGIVFLNVLDPASDRREIRAQARTGRWALGEPDLIAAVPQTAPASARGHAGRIQRSVIDPGLRQDRWLGALEYRPADARSTRAAVFTVDGTGQWLATWTPWHGFRRLPEGTAYRLGAGAKIRAEVFTTEAVDAIDGPGEIGLHFDDSPARAAVADISLAGSGEVRAGTASHRLHAEATLADDTAVLALWPAVIPGIQSIELTAQRPDGKVEILLFALDIPAEWPTPYIYKTPVELPRGSRLALTVYVSSSAADLAENPVELTLSTVSRPL